MAATTKKSNKVLHIPAPIARPFPVGTVSGGVSPPVQATPTPATPAVVASTAAPSFTVPAPPPGFVPVKLLDYRGQHLQAAQLVALPDAILELQGLEDYAQTFGSAVAPAAQIVSELQVASAWTTTRVALEALLVYAKSNEAVTWKSCSGDLEQLAVVFEAVAKQSPALVAGCPALVRVFAARKVVGQRAAATRKRNAKAEAAKEATAASDARASSAGMATAVTSGSAAGPATTPVTTAPLVATTAPLVNGATH
jgi:hypothetical protein